MFGTILVVMPILIGRIYGFANFGKNFGFLQLGSSKPGRIMSHTLLFSASPGSGLCSIVTPLITNYFIQTGESGRVVVLSIINCPFSLGSVALLFYVYGGLMAFLGILLLLVRPTLYHY